MHLGHILFRQRERAACSLLTLSIEARCLIVGNSPSGSYFQRERLEFHCVDHVWRAFLHNGPESQHVDHVWRESNSIYLCRKWTSTGCSSKFHSFGFSHLPISKHNIQEYRWGINNCSVDGNRADRYPNSRSRWHLSRLISSLWSLGKKRRHWQI